MRLISATEFENLMQVQMARGATIVEAMHDALQDATVIDAVEVVRCHKCRHYADSVCDYHAAAVLPSWFCWQGEKC